jgi:hypothetical protein
MTTTGDLAQRITAALDKAEMVANASARGGLAVTVGIKTVSNAAEAAVVAHWNAWKPARVLALITTDRRVLERHHTVWAEPETSWEWCKSCRHRDRHDCDDVLDLAARWGVTP